MRRVIRGMQRRGMFHSVEFCSDNSPRRLQYMIAKWRSSLPEIFGFVEGDVQVLTHDWLARMLEIMNGNPRIGMLGSRIDERDFIDWQTAVNAEPNMPEEKLADLIKWKSAERGPDPPGNPPGRLLLIRTETLDTVPVNIDAYWARNMRTAGWEALIAEDVVHRHLSLLNFFDYHDYDMAFRDAFFAKVNPANELG